MIYDFVRFVSGIPFFLICAVFVFLFLSILINIKNMPLIIKMAIIFVFVLFYSAFIGAKFFENILTVPTRWLQNLPISEKKMMEHEIWENNKPLTIYKFVYVNRLYQKENAFIHSKPQKNEKQVSPIIKKELHTINEN